MKRGGKRWREEGEENLFIAVSVTGHQTRKTHDSKANPNNGSTPNTIKKIKREKSNINLKQKNEKKEIEPETFLYKIHCQTKHNLTHKITYKER